MKKIINFLLSWILFTILVLLCKDLWFRFAPLSFWIEYESITLFDKKQWDEKQLLHSIRYSKQNTIWNYTYKTYCNWRTDTSWIFSTTDVLLQKTDKLTTVIVDLDIPYSLPVWQCITYIFINIDIWKWYSRDIIFKTEYQVLEKD